MSEQYQLDIMIAECHYQDLAGPSWPSYQDYVSDWRADKDITQEILTLEKQGDLVATRRLRDSRTKVDFLLDSVYSPARTWHDWLRYEWKWRGSLSDIIDFDHAVPSLPSAHDIVLTIRPEQALACYFKFNSGLNHRSPQQFVSDVESFNHAAGTHCAHQMICVDDLFSPVLDLDIYHRLCSAAGITANDQVAQNIHQRWYQLHRTAQQDFLAVVLAMYTTDAPRITVPA